jgi:hypothetical protein
LYCTHRQYAGTGALKSGFTRTGKRTVAGLIDDGVKSMTRYYLNNFKVRLSYCIKMILNHDVCTMHPGLGMFE